MPRRMNRVGNNPFAFADMTPWPVNIAWALLSDRRSCYAGSELALAYAPLTSSQRQEIDQQFTQLFDGKGSPDDVRDLAQTHQCRVIVVTPQDGAWASDPFRHSPFYHLIEERARRVADLPGGRTIISADGRGYNPLNQLKPLSSQYPPG